MEESENVKFDQVVFVTICPLLLGVILRRGLAWGRNKGVDVGGSETRPTFKSSLITSPS